MKKFTTEAQILPESKGQKNVVTALVVGMKYTDDDSGFSVYRDKLVSLADPDPENFIAFEDITEDWCLPVCEKAAADGDWEASMIAEVEAALTRPVSKLFKFQESNKE